MVKENKTIVIGADKDPYQVPLNLNRLSRYLEYIIPNSKRELKDLYKKLDLDSDSRRRNRNTVKFQTDEKKRRNLNSINKGLTLELFASGMISYFDHPGKVHANCLVTRHEIPGANADNQYHVLPYNFAQRGVPDVEIDYGDFKVILEVSAKSQPPVEHLQSQMTGALIHARAIRESGYDKPLYCLLIHELSLKKSDNRDALKECLKTIKSSEQIYITLISIQEFAELGQDMARKYKEDVLNVQSNDLLNVLKSTVEKAEEGLFDQLFLKHLESIKTPSESDWF